MRRVFRDAWLAPLTLGPGQHGPVASKTGYRASDKGFLNMSLDDYFELLVFAGKQGRSDSKQCHEQSESVMAQVIIDIIFELLH